MTESDRVGRTVLAAAIVFMASADGPISAEAWGQLRSVVGSDEDLLETAIELARNTPIQEFLKEVDAVLDDDQRLCLLLNVFDSMWSDENATPRQLELFNQFQSSLSIQDQALNTYLKGLQIKNAVPLLDSLKQFSAIKS
jgi:hypothetical protein